jgi:hypothetical protein
MGQFCFLAAGFVQVIDFRYHIVSLISVFLALALGIIVGTTQLNGAVLSDLRSQVRGLKDDKQSLQHDKRDLQGRIKADDEFARNVAPSVVAGTLTDAKVVLVSAPNADGKVTNGVADTIEKAGGSVTARVQLTSDYLDPRRAPDLKSYITSALPAGFTLPTTDDAGALAASLLADVLVTKPNEKDPTTQERQSVLAGFGTLSVLRLQDQDVAPADYAVLVTSGEQSGDNPQDQNDSLSDLSSALDNRAKGFVVAGSAGAAEDNGLLNAIRGDDALSNNLSTVDNADCAAGQITTALALQASGQNKKPEQYGIAGNASASTVPVSGG